MNHVLLRPKLKVAIIKRYYSITDLSDASKKIDR
jgi:hypothetical protein